MNCFYHPGVAAVGICKSCSKGICPSCANDLGKGLACRGHCEGDAIAVINLLESNIRNAPVYDSLLATARKNRMNGPIFMFVMGLIFLGLGLYQYVSDGYRFENSSVQLVLGTFFIVMGCFIFLRRPRIPGPNEPANR
jgi:hypothetical protein